MFPSIFTGFAFDPGMIPSGRASNGWTAVPGRGVPAGSRLACWAGRLPAGTPRPGTAVHPFEALPEGIIPGSNAKPVKILGNIGFFAGSQLGPVRLATGPAALRHRHMRRDATMRE